LKKIKQLILIILSVLNTFGCFAQDLSSQIKTLQLNSAPAYVILGVEPENIQRPNSPSEFISNVQSAVVNGRLQPNFAMETTPYFWLKKNKGKNQFDLLDHMVNNKYGVNLLKSFSLSFASSPSDTFTFGNIPQGTGIGIGAHIQLLHGRISKKNREFLASIFYDTRTQLLFESMIGTLEANKTIKSLDEFFAQEFSSGSLKKVPESERSFIENLIKNMIGKNSVTPADLDEIKKLRDKIKVQSQDDVKKANAALPLTREGFMLELAAADARIAEKNEINNISYAKTAIWLTPSYRLNISKDLSVVHYIDVMAVARITINTLRVDSTDYMDAGGKIQWIRNRLSVSCEFIYRYLSKVPKNQEYPYTYKSDFTFSYKLNELVTFKATFGKSFDGNSAEYSKPSKIFIVGGLNFGINGLKPSNN
jgi:hypothetical protein